MNARYLKFHYTLKDDAGRVLDTSRGGEPLACVEGEGHIVEGLEAELRTMQPGDRRAVAVPPERGYGVRDDGLVGRIPRDRLPVDEVRIGDRYRTGTDQHAPIVTVIAIEGDQVTLDANHPLAGQTLYFDVELVSAEPMNRTGE